MFAKARANELGLTGWVKNTTWGGVEGEAQGEQESMKKLVEFLKKGPRGSHVEKFEQYDVHVHENERSFSVRH
ncbi:hypothetical protein AURDEDRAFT_158615 [Auricularia subglabra TFB-10046 SS5]|nr:hypothetical protein AURDEDRAFT_158615 [Auricularia subglabra TFB-10046 SS5]